MSCLKYLPYQLLLRRTELHKAMLTLDYISLEKEIVVIVPQPYVLAALDTSCTCCSYAEEYQRAYLIHLCTRRLSVCQLVSLWKLFLLPAEFGETHCCSLVEYETTFNACECETTWRSHGHTALCQQWEVGLVMEIGWKPLKPLNDVLKFVHGFNQWCYCSTRVKETHFATQVVIARC